MGLGRKILLELGWSRLIPHPEWTHPHASGRDRIQPYAAGTEDGVRVVYFPVAGLVRNSLGFHSIRLNELGTTSWRVRFINPRSGLEEKIITIEAEADGTATLTGGPAGPLPSKEDWLLVATHL